MTYPVYNKKDPYPYESPMLKHVSALPIQLTLNKKKYLVVKK